MTMLAKMTDHAERRREDRLEVEMRGRFSSMREWRSVCQIDNVSRRGVHLKTDAELAEGAAIWLRLPGMEPRPGRIVWSGSATAGCLFDDPLDQAELDRLATVSRRIPN